MCPRETIPEYQQTSQSDSQSPLPHDQLFDVGPMTIKIAVSVFAGLDLALYVEQFEQPSFLLVKPSSEAAGAIYSQCPD
jgi:hypothetical protein